MKLGVDTPTSAVGAVVNVSGETLPSMSFRDRYAALALSRVAWTWPERVASASATLAAITVGLVVSSCIMYMPYFTAMAKTVTNSTTINPYAGSLFQATNNDIGNRADAHERDYVWLG